MFVRLLALCVLVAGCGAASPVGGAGGPRADEPITLALTTTDGRIVEVADQRGGLVLLFVLATYDGLSQAAVRPVSRFTREATDTVVLGVVAERDAASFAPIYAETLSPPYTVVYDADQTITEGTSALGELPGVPTFYMIDAHGLVSERRTGYLTEAELFAMRDHARARGGIAPTPPSTP
jgi:hypothetical protein